MSLGLVANSRDVTSDVIALQVLAKGLLLGKHAYLKSGWNIMDGFLVFISLVDICFVMLSSSQTPRIFGILRVFRLLRTLRPLRQVSSVIHFYTVSGKKSLRYFWHNFIEYYPVFRNSFTVTFS